MPYQRLWIEEGCISCNLCEDIVKEVFEVPAGETCRLREGYRRHLTSPDVQTKAREAIDSCPVDVIKGA